MLRESTCMELDLGTVLWTSAPRETDEARLSLDYVQRSRPGVSGGDSWVNEVFLSGYIQVYDLSKWGLVDGESHRGRKRSSRVTEPGRVISKT